MWRKSAVGRETVSTSPSRITPGDEPNGEKSRSGCVLAALVQGTSVCAPCLRGETQPATRDITPTQALSCKGCKSHLSDPVGSRRYPQPTESTLRRRRRLDAARDSDGRDGRHSKEHFGRREFAIRSHRSFHDDWPANESEVLHGRSAALHAPVPSWPRAGSRTARHGALQFTPISVRALANLAGILRRTDTGGTANAPAVAGVRVDVRSPCAVLLRRSVYDRCGHNRRIVGFWSSSSSPS